MIKNRTFDRTKPLRIVTLCSGYDSQCLALEYLKDRHPEFAYELVGWSEIEPSAIVGHNLLFPQYAERNLGDMTKIDWGNVSDCDLITYSTPCTDFSMSGKRMGGEEGSGTRSSLLWYTRNAILAKRPKYLMMENVKGLLTKTFKPLFDKWLAELESYGYANFAQVLNAKDYGVPQNRERIFVISIRKDNDEPSPRYVFPAPMPLTVTCEDIVEDNVDDKYYLKGEYVKKYCDITNVDKYIAENGL